jgi:small-conductance mechanosensitive channel
MKRPMDRRQALSTARFRIDELFRENGIVIAFPQRDVHLESLKPIEVRLMDDQPEGN